MQLTDRNNPEKLLKNPRLSRLRFFRQRTQLNQQTLDFLRRVVVRQTDPQHASALLHAQALGQVDGVVVAVPGEDAALAKTFGHFAGRVAFHANGDGGRALVELRRIGNAVKRESRNGEQPTDKLRGQFALVLLEDFISRNDRLAAGVDLGAVMASDLGDVVDGGGHSGHALVVLRTGLPAIGQLLAAHAQLVGTQALQQFALAVENALVRTEKLVAGASEEVGVDGLHVDEAVWSVVHRVDKRHRSFGVRQPDGFLNIVDGTHSVRGPAYCDQARVAANLGLQIEHVDGAVGGLDVRGTDLGAALFQTDPGRDVGVVIEAGDQ